MANNHKEEDICWFHSNLTRIQADELLGKGTRAVKVQSA